MNRHKCCGIFWLRVVWKQYPLHMWHRCLLTLNVYIFFESTKDLVLKVDQRKSCQRFSKVGIIFLLSMQREKGMDMKMFQLVEDFDSLNWQLVYKSIYVYSNRDLLIYLGTYIRRCQKEKKMFSIHLCRSENNLHDQCF